MPQLDMLSYFELITFICTSYIIGLVFIALFVEIDHIFNNIKQISNHLLIKNLSENVFYIKKNLSLLFNY